MDHTREKHSLDLQSSASKKVLKIFAELQIPGKSQEHLGGMGSLQKFKLPYLTHKISTQSMSSAFRNLNTFLAIRACLAIARFLIAKPSQV